MTTRWANIYRLCLTRPGVGRSPDHV